MIVSLIVAMGKNQEIGKDNKLLWHITDDLKNFKRVTLSHHLIMGRKTYESIGRPLPKRTTIVITRNKDYEVPDGVFIAHSIESAIALANSHGEDELFVCGGGEIYKKTVELNLVDKLYLSEVDFEIEADVFFPKIDLSKWKTTAEILHDANEKCSLSWRYTELTR